ncbi:unnamed protein product [Nezara viridula]|uniref:Uncharacterized protein n=1 Tax=Nezara viridula TaxID=85310 RepID=A0A9P0HS16_NEZVI|nr:unnamed protein product [Nezara viridula]
MGNFIKEHSSGVDLGFLLKERSITRSQYKKSTPIVGFGLTWRGWHGTEHTLT